MTSRISRYGSSALLIECPPADVLGLRAAVQRSAIREIIEVIPGATSLLTTLSRDADVANVRRQLAALSPISTSDAQHPLLTLRVVYDGPDLEAVANASGLSPEEVVAIHSSADYRVAFCGFAPGFGYLTGLDKRLHLPRRSSPRPRVPAGSVAVAAEYTAVYPTASPGGWNLIGRCDDVLFDPSMHPPSRLAPGQPVRFEPL